MVQVDDRDIAEITSYSDVQYREARQRLLAHPLLPTFVKKYFPKTAFDDFQTHAKSLDTVADFQRGIISNVMNAMVSLTSSGLSVSGLENHSKSGKFLYISNHRDIICDPAIFTNTLFLHGFGTPKICLGDNLLLNQLIIDLVKMNKGITVKRDLSKRDFLKWSFTLSKLIYRELSEQTDSVWIAQREGRTKDGNDSTHVGVLKMLTLASQKPFAQSISELHVVPVSISYEYDPGDILKAKEVYIRTSTGSYSKAKDEDLNSMIEGINGFKGHIHISVGKELIDIEAIVGDVKAKNEGIKRVAKEIDSQIQSNYRVWPTGFVAYDLRYECSTFSDRYSSEQKDQFIDRMEARLRAVVGDNIDKEALKKCFLDIYANPVCHLSSK